MGTQRRQNRARRKNEGSGVAFELKHKAEEDDKLEVRLDESWYSAKLSLGEECTMKVFFDGYTNEKSYQQWDKKKIESFKPIGDYIRVLSEPLQDKECGLVHVASIVCALRKACWEEMDRWHDAIVFAVGRGDHIQGENCTCSFEVVWLEGPDKGETRTLGCGEISLLSPKDVQTHPLILDLLRRADQEDEDDEWLPEKERVRQFKRRELKGPSIGRKMRGQVQFLYSNFSNAHPLQQAYLRITGKSGADSSGEYQRNQVQQEVRISPNANALQEQSSEEEQQLEVRQVKRLKPESNAARVTEIHPLTTCRPPKRDVSKDRDSAEGEGRRTNEVSGFPVVSKDKAGKDDKLEVNLDGTWYTARLSLGEDCTTNVHYDGYTDEEEDQKWDAKKIKSFKPLGDYIRVFSEQLQDEECGLVHISSIVCAMRKATEEIEGWHDSIVTSVVRGDHIHGENCTCSFKVVWLDGPDKGQTATVGCGEIALLSTKDVQTHPCIVDLLRHADQDDVGSEPKEQQEEVLQVKSDLTRVKVQSDDSLRPAKKVNCHRLSRKISRRGRVVKQRDTKLSPN